MNVEIRAAEPGDAAALVALATAVGSEPQGWLLADSHWRSVADERRYVRALRRHPVALTLRAWLGALARAAGACSRCRSSTTEPHNRYTAAQARGSRVPSMAAWATSVRRRLWLRA